MKPRVELYASEPARDARWGLLLLAFLESFGTILLERGYYFYTHDLLGFSDPQNLGLALAFGAAYVAGALASHPVTHRTGEKRALVACLAALFLVHLGFTLAPTSVPFLVVAYPLNGLLQGFKWPIIESYVSAGRSPRQMSTVLARFNVAWALGVPLAIALVGPINESGWPPLLFALAAAINLLALALVHPLRPRPLHLHAQHPERPDPAALERYRTLLVVARWSMLGGYSLLFLISPLLPAVFAALGVRGTDATVSAALLDVVRLLTFAAMGAFVGWHGRPSPLVFATLGLPAGFLLVMFGPSVPAVLLGEAVFGAAAGVSYFAALYYATVVKNASVDAGGAHEGLIGAGFALGPLIGLSGYALAPYLGQNAALLFATAPLLVLTTLGALRPLPRLRTL